MMRRALLACVVLVLCFGCHRDFGGWGDQKTPEAPPIKPLTTDDILNRGLNHLREYRLDEAEKDFKHVLTKRPKSLSARLNLATVALRRGDLKSAHKRYQALIPAGKLFKPEDRSEVARVARIAHRNIIRAQLWDGRVKPAIAQFELYKKVSGKIEQLQLKLAMVARFPHSLRRYGEVQKDPKRTLPDLKMYNEAVKNLEKALVGVCAGAKWRSVACDKALRPIKMRFKQYTLDKKLGFYQADNNLAVTRCYLGDLIRCQRNLKGGLKFNSSSKRMLYNIAITHLVRRSSFFARQASEMKKIRKAKMRVERMLIKAPNPGAFYLEGVLALLNSNRDKAVKALEKIKDKTSPEAVWLNHWLTLLK